MVDGRSSRYRDWVVWFLGGKGLIRCHGTTTDMGMETRTTRYTDPSRGTVTDRLLLLVQTSEL